MLALNFSFHYLHRQDTPGMRRAILDLKVSVGAAFRWIG